MRVRLTKKIQGLGTVGDEISVSDARGAHLVMSRLAEYIDKNPVTEETQNQEPEPEVRIRKKAVKNADEM